jgi:hypothetical protein
MTYIYIEIEVDEQEEGTEELEQLNSLIALCEKKKLSVGTSEMTLEQKRYLEQVLYGAAEDALTWEVEKIKAG